MGRGGLQWKDRSELFWFGGDSLAGVPGFNCQLDYLAFFDFFLAAAGLLLLPPALLAPFVAPLLLDSASHASPAAVDDEAAGLVARVGRASATPLAS